MPLTINPKQGEIWKVDLNPVEGSEMGKIRPVVVISNDSLNQSSLRIAVPITGYKPKHDNFVWVIKITPDKSNCLTKDSVADSMNIRSVDLTRFQQKTGSISIEQLDEILLAVHLITDR